MRLLFCAIIGMACALSVAGCQTTPPPATETIVDQELTTQSTPNAPPPETVQGEPRQGFEQESPKSQAP